MRDPQSPLHLIQGTVRKPAPPLSAAHQPIVKRIHAAMDEYVTPRHLGRLWNSIEVVLDRREGIVVQPDIVFLVDGRESIVTDCVWGPPDMVLEVTSPQVHSSQLEERVAWFSVYGVREYWLVNPEHREVAILELAHGGVRCRWLFDARAPIRTPLFADFDRPLAEMMPVS